MKVVLRTDVEQVGKKGDIVDVSDGYARNYLVPKGLAMRATAGAESQAGVKLDRRRVQLDEPIKALGTHTVPVKLHADVEFPVTLEVVGE